MRPVICLACFGLPHAARFLEHVLLALREGFELPSRQHLRRALALPAEVFTGLRNTLFDPLRGDRIEERAVLALNARNPGSKLLPFLLHAPPLLPEYLDELYGLRVGEVQIVRQAATKIRYRFAFCEVVYVVR